LIAESYLPLLWTFKGPNCTLSSMKHDRLSGHTNPARIAGDVLSILVVLSILLFAPTVGLSQGSGKSPAVANAANPGASSASVQAKPQPAPNAAPLPFLRLVAVLCSGLVISTARLARKFHRFWGLGVFTSPYAVLFVIFGVGLCGIPVTSESALRSLPYVGSLGPWIADLSGVILTLVLPSIGRKQQVRPAGEGQLRDLEGESSSNPILALIEDAIRDRILARMQVEVVAACRRYDWETIKLAAWRALEEEMTIRPLDPKKYDATRQSIENFQADPDSHVDSRNKYAALLGLLRWCSFRRLHRGLDAAAREMQL
jgi:hypothetical protein